MTVHFSTDNHIKGSEKFIDTMSIQVSDALANFSEHITRVDVHLSDENGSKTGPADKRCVMEARVEGKQPMAVTSHANTVDQAVNGAITKLLHSLDTMTGKLHSHRHVDYTQIEDFLVSDN
jgi:ribosome-associated translation inhibitor RaiA